MFGLSTHVSDDELKDLTYTRFSILVDIDGAAHSPNTFGKDFFAFEKYFTNDLQLSKLTMSLTYDSTIDENAHFKYNFTSREKLMDVCKTYGISCGALIMRDGWQIKDDYPWL